MEDNDTFDEDTDIEHRQLIPCDTEPDLQVNHDYKYSIEAQQVLSESIRLVQYVIICGICGSIAYTSRFSIWYLYAREFDDATEVSIAFMLNAGILCNCIVGLIYPCLSDVYGYDKIIVFKLFILCIGVFGECIAMNFIFLSVFFIVSQTQFLAVATAYIAWILPHEYAIRYVSHYYSTFAITYLLGPMVAGILSHFLDYRSTFWFNFIICVLMILFAFIFILNKQRKLEQKQLALKEEFSKSNIAKKYIFPIINHGDKNKSDFKAFFNSISKFEWIQLINIIIQNSLVTANETIFVSYSSVFLMDNFDCNVMTATGQIFMMCFGFIVGNALIPHIIDNKKLLFPLHNKYFILITSSCINIILFAVFTKITNIDILWMLNAFIGLFLGFVLMTQEVFILRLQPTDHAGKVSGIKTFSRYMIPAIAGLITGLLYSQNVQYAFIYVISCCYIISLILAIIFMRLQFLYSNRLEN